jgi:hypothetical protein
MDSVTGGGSGEPETAGAFSSAGHHGGSG